MKPLSQTRTTYLKPERLEFSALAALHQKLLAPKLMFTPEKLELCCMGLRLIDASYIKPKTIGTQTQTSKKNAVGTQVDLSLPTTTTTSCDTSKSFFKECYSSDLDTKSDSLPSSVTACDDDCENFESSQGSSSCSSMSGDTKRIPAGNLLTSASILFSGNTFSKISQLASFLN